ncbi:neuropeptide CCHamide-1 receptor-like [Amphiura filiformis]|uniref:neuropeptide CCHamide-1 receptor-like n=1 Tax=Amphiura filiformis TaxID=82378 RepID=UPI003B20F6EE
MSDLVKSICQLSLQNLGHCLVFSLFTVIGVLGNVTLLFTILLNRQLLSVPNIFIVNLTIGDLVYMLATAPFNIRHELTACWLLGTTACKIKHYVPIVAQGACVFSLAALSRERYTAIVKGFESRHKSSRRTLLIIGICWFVGLIIGIPVLVITKTNTFGLLCQYMPNDDGFTWAKGYVIFIFLILYIIPFFVISVNYAQVARTLCNNNIARLTDNNQAAIRHVHVRKRLALIVIIITAFFGLFWFPYHVYHMWYMFTKNHSNIRGNTIQVQFFRHFYNYMSLANSCLNPWVVFLMSSAHRSPLIRCYRKLSCSGWQSKLNRRRQPKITSIAVTSSGSYGTSTSTSKV